MNKEKEFKVGDKVIFYDVFKKTKSIGVVLKCGWENVYGIKNPKNYYLIQLDNNTKIAHISDLSLYTMDETKKGLLDE